MGQAGGRPSKDFALPLTHLRGVLAKPETLSAEAGVAIASRRNAAWRLNLGPPPARHPYLGLRSALFVKNLHSGDVLRQAPVRDDQAWIVALPRGEDGVPGGGCREAIMARALAE